jgi:DNA-binding GntR family transcriptional regulator
LAAEVSPLVGLAPIGRRDPLRLKVAESVRNLIVEGRLPSGCHLVESELATAVGVSRQPVREALQILAHDGWIDLRPGYGAFVHTPTAQEIDDIFRVRTALEGDAAARAAERVREGTAPAGSLERLRCVLEEGALGSTDADTTRIVDYNSVLHAAIIDIAGNRVLADMAAAIAGRVRWYFAAIAVVRAPSSWKEHASVVNAILAGDSPGAGELMRAHTSRSRDLLLEIPLGAELP